jgi:hypothetical protein
VFCVAVSVDVCAFVYMCVCACVCVCVCVCVFLQEHVCLSVCPVLQSWCLLPYLTLLSLQAGCPQLFWTASLLCTLVEKCPSIAPAAIDANVVPGLVRVLGEVRTRFSSGLEDTGNLWEVVEPPLSCLKQLLWYNMLSIGALGKAAVDAGIVPILVDLLKFDDEVTIVLVVRVSALLLVPAPRETVGAWGRDLMRASARLLTASRPVTQRDTIEMLAKIGETHPQLLVDCHTWGIDDAVQRLTIDSDVATAAAALKLKKLFGRAQKRQDVSQPSQTTSDHLAHC